MTQKHTLTSPSRKASTFIGGGFLLLSLLAVVVQWLSDDVLSEQLLRVVPKVGTWNFLESRWTYFYLHVFTVLPVFSLSFDRNVQYFRQWKHLGLPIFFVGLFFIGWDVAFAKRGVWGFNHHYVSGAYFLGLPIEEWLFFITVPFACVFIYECLNFYVKDDILGAAEKIITPVLIFIFFAFGVLFFPHQYTSTTFLLSGGALGGHYFLTDGRYRSRFYLAYLVSWIPFLFVNGVLTGGYTQEPVVMYNPEEYLGIRVMSVPLDDAIYNFLMLLMVLTGYERLRSGRW